MTTTNTVNIRHIDAATWRQLRVETVRHGLTISQLVNTILAEWLAQHTCADEGTEGRSEK